MVGFWGRGMIKAWAGFLVLALAAGSTTPLYFDLAFAQQLPAQAAAAQPAPEAAAPQSAQEPAGQVAANCPGHPDAPGTSRVLALDPTKHPRVGSMQYPDSLPLNDKEVVLTFDDGPILPYSNQILDILASQCVKATYFLVGEMAASPVWRDPMSPKANSPRVGCRYFHPTLTPTTGIIASVANRSLLWRCGD
jgi:hypothetical protein